MHDRQALANALLQLVLRTDHDVELALHASADDRLLCLHLAPAIMSFFSRKTREPPGVWPMVVRSITSKV